MWEAPEKSQYHFSFRKDDVNQDGEMDAADDGFQVKKDPRCLDENQKRRQDNWKKEEKIPEKDSFHFGFCPCQSYNSQKEIEQGNVNDTPHDALYLGGEQVDLCGKVLTNP